MVIRDRIRIAASAAVISVGALMFFPALVPEQQRRDAPALALRLAPGRAAPGDEAPLRSGMQAIRSALASADRTVRAGMMTPALYDALGEKIDVEIARIAEHCGVVSERDPNVHLALSELGAAAEVMKGKAGAGPRDTGLVKAVATVEAYGQFFETRGGGAPA